MINLIPTQEFSSMTYARRNTLLMRWISMLLIGFVVTVLIVFGGRLIINRSTQQVTKQSTIAQENLKDQKVDEVQSKVEDISSSLKLATQVLSRQVILSKLIQQIATVLPSGTALSGLQLNKVTGGMDLSVLSTDFQTATQVQINLRDPDNKLFSQADINDIDCGTSTDLRYPCLGSFRVLFADDNPYVLLNESSKP